jgi:hypothetical protein
LQDPSKCNVNDKVVVNCAAATGYLSAISSDPAQMKALFETFDETGNDAAILPVKIAILTNGNDIIDKSGMMASLEVLLSDILVERAGFEEIDDDPAPLIGDDDEEKFKFTSPLEMLGYFLDKMCRRKECIAPDNKALRSVYAVINNSGIFKKLSEEKEICVESFMLLTDFLKSVPVVSAKPGAKLSDELS